MLKNSPALTISLLFLFLFALLSAQANGLNRKVGGRTKVKDVENNKEIQQLGKYCVEEYNRQQQHQANGSSTSTKLLAFSHVVEAETQVVSGFKYYLKISAASHGGVPKVFSAVVVVKPWLQSRELVSFSPLPAIK